MCKHILNAQVAIRTPCCKKWYDCPECHQDNEDHPLMKTTDMVFACKKCKKVFRKDMSLFEDSDEYCPRCDNHYIIEAKTPETEGRMVIEIEGSENIIKDDRVKSKHTAAENRRALFDAFSRGE